MRAGFVVSIGLLLAGYLTPPALGGQWSSGGGELIKDGDNPWFIQNTTEVGYCILVGPDFSEQSLGVLDGDIQDAAKFWRDRLALVYRHWHEKLPGGDIVKLATQDFKRLDCSDSRVDVRFQFGVLSDAQRRYLRTPSSYAAISVRTDYDAVNLRGKGFVYVSPDSGPDKYREPHLVDRAWTQGDGGLVYTVLVHELGHINGFPHIPSYAPGEFWLPGLMSENFAEYVLNLDHYRGYIERRPKLPFLVFDPAAMSTTPVAPGKTTYFSWGIGGIDGSMSPAFDFFDTHASSPPGTREDGFEFVLGTDGLDVYQHSAGLIGRIVTAVPLDFTDPSLPFNVYPSSHLYLTAKQRVFNLGSDARFLPLALPLYQLMVFSIHGTYIPLNGGDSRPINIAIGGTDFKISGAVNGIEYPDLLRGDNIFQ